MESVQTLLQSTIVAVNQYSSHKIERNFDFLQKQIDILIAKTSRGHSLKFFNLTDVVPSECLACLVNLISDPGIKHTLLLKSLLLFNNLVCDSTIRESLHEKFQLTPALASVIRYHGSTNSDTLTAEALQLLQKVSYGHRISFEEGYMDHLIKFLLKQITFPSTGLTKPAMGVLVNLARDNFSVQSFIRNHENMQDLARKLTKLLGDENQAVIVLSLTLMVFLCLQEKIANKFFNEKNSPKTCQMIFNTLIDDPLAGETRRYAVDLLKDILRVETLRKSLASYQFLGSCLEQTVSLLNTSSPDSVIKIFELLQTLCDVPSIKQMVCRCLIATFPLQETAQLPNLPVIPLSKIADPLLATIHWAGQSPETHGLAPLGALDLLGEVYEELVFAHDKVHHEKHVQALLPTLAHMLKAPLEGSSSNTVIQRKLMAMVKALCNDDTLLNLISKRLDAAQLIRLMHHQFQHNTITLRTRISAPSDDWSAAGVDLVLYLLDLMSVLKNQQLEDFFIATMQETHVVPFLAYGLCSGNRQRVKDTMALVCLSASMAEFPVILLSDAVATMNADKEARLSASQNLHGGHYPVIGQLGAENKENGYESFGSSRLLSESKDDSNTRMDVSEESIHSIIEKMNCGMKLQPADMKSGDVVAIYESSIHSLQTRERQLQDLLEAKTLALNQADRMLAQYRARRGQEDTEANRLRMLLLQAEKRNAMFEKECTEMRTRVDQYVGEIEELNEENQKLKQVAQMHQELTAAHTDLTDRYEELSKVHQTISQEHQSLSEMHEMLQKHNTNLKQQYDIAMEQLNTIQEERRKVAATLRKTEEKLEDTTKASLKWEYDYKRSEEERETMDMCIDKLRSDMGKLEHKKKQLLEQVNQAEFKGTQSEQKIQALEDELQEMKGEIAKQRQITALINSLSSGGGASDVSKDGQ